MLFVSPSPSSKPHKKARLEKTPPTTTPECNAEEALTTSVIGCSLLKNVKGEVIPNVKIPI